MNEHIVHYDSSLRDQVRRLREVLDGVSRQADSDSLDPSRPISSQVWAEGRSAGLQYALQRLDAILSSTGEEREEKWQPEQIRVMVEQIRGLRRRMLADPENGGLDDEFVMWAELARLLASAPGQR